MKIKYVLRYILKIFSVILFLILIILAIKDGEYPKGGMHWFFQLLLLSSFVFQLISQWRKFDKWTKMFYLEGIVLIIIGLFNTFFRK